ncbi:MAG: 30S ribosomal protein S3 [Euryarchaeota archaeon]|nr:30S ribosomal protein S3 [Euryarchaeota archaeon]
MALERKFIEDNIRKFEVKEFLQRELERAGCGEIEIQRTPLGTRVIVHVQRPGLVIGRKGQAIRKLTTILKTRFGLDNPQVEVNELEVPELNPNVMARSIANALERGIHFRRAAYTALRRIMEAGARGAEITISGKLTGERAKSVKFVDGYLKHCGEPAMMYVKEGYAVAAPKPGVIGVKVKIMPPGTRLPDDIIFKEEPQAEAPPQEERPEEEVEKVVEQVQEELAEEAKQSEGGSGEEEQPQESAAAEGAEEKAEAAENKPEEGEEKEEA